MKEQKETKLDKKTTQNPILLIVVSVLLTALFVGGLVYFWQNQQSTKLQKQIDNLEAQVKQEQSLKTQAETEKTDLEETYCKGTWQNGVCILQTCVDSDVNEKPEDIYIKGTVTYTDDSGVSNEVSDECSGSKNQVNEMWCYESPSGTGNYVPGKMVYDCANGCLDGACIK
ncbi:hypothetical protein KC660_00740 [Candidatus Dojkabacteria bacterium]|uniref:Uncharacterized protein n=1 Tax=Candidatus Dojkabacteria bacterium TaxID=2099670 RepID=A0A955L2Z0_9BACT|nr:hypothetical protein [Candidatus Dojkabacteria bacterium]